MKKILSREAKHISVLFTFAGLQDVISELPAGESVKWNLYCAQSIAPPEIWVCIHTGQTENSHRSEG